MDAQARIEQMVVIALLLILVVGCFLVLRPFLSALLWALILSFSTWPLYDWLVRVFGGRRTLAAALMTLLVAVVLVLPPVAVGSSLADNVAQVVAMVRTLLAQGLPGPPGWVLELPLIGANLHDGWQELSEQGTAWTAVLRPYVETARDLLLSTGVTLGQGVLQLSLSVLAAFFFFRDGAAGGRQLDAAFQRLAGERARRLLAVAGGTIRGVVYGIIGTALAQATLQAIGLWLAGVPAAAFLGFLTFFLSFVPMGPALVWLPATIWLFYKGALGWGVFMAIWGFFVVSGVDNVLKPWLISRGSKLPLILVFLGVLGGVVAFGVL
ncbi:MAG TPA: AI-2E family transporter, partial [Geminicoccaceae bacterium]|nr:AI-2E family transporter [Geminicoccaceae bacterium]